MSQPLFSPTAVPSSPNDPVKDVGLSSFMLDVIEASRIKPVIVDFWAPWCGPCKQLTPILEKLVRAAKSAVTLAKIDIDKNPEIAQQMGVQSVPAVFAFFQGKPIDGFMGALPEIEVKAWIDKLLKLTGAAAAEDDTVDLKLALDQAADYLAAKDIATAHAIYIDVMDQDPTNAAAYAGIVRCLLTSGETAKARQVLDSAPADIAKNKALDPARAAVELAEQASHAGSTQDLETALQKNPADHQARFDLSLAYFGAERREEAVDQLLEIIRRDRKWNEEAARKQLVKFFDAFGAMDPLTIATRRRLSSILFS